eukprot:9182564-Pyramimonas_sp.AAC.1
MGALRGRGADRASPATGAAFDFLWSRGKRALLIFSDLRGAHRGVLRQFAVESAPSDEGEVVDRLQALFALVFSFRASLRQPALVAAAAPPWPARVASPWPARA